MCINIDEFNNHKEMIKKLRAELEAIMVEAIENGIKLTEDEIKDLTGYADIASDKLTAIENDIKEIGEQ